MKNYLYKVAVAFLLFAAIVLVIDTFVMSLRIVAFSLKLVVLPFAVAAIVYIYFHIKHK
jgi:hypothetical protein